MKSFVLADCNNFFVSCERVFNPQLIGKPVVVLSSNDACVIARSAEAKALGIPMGIPAYQCKEIFRRHNVISCSANFALYGDMSSRVMHILSSYATDIELYSIDEMFLFLPDYTHKKSVYGYATYYSDHLRHIRAQIKKQTGIPISLGMAPTKTLAKLANSLAKKDPYGIYVLPTHYDELLKKSSVSDIWGIGYRYTKKLHTKKIFTASDFKYAAPAMIQKLTSINGLRTQQELWGNPCILLDPIHVDKKSLTVSRSFGKNVTDLHELKEAVAYYITQAAEKLRAQQMHCSSITLFLITRPHHDARRMYYTGNSTLAMPTSYTPTLIDHAHALTMKLYKTGIIYKKAGVILTDFVSATTLQMNVFIPSLPNTPEQSLAMTSVDSVNAKWGKNTLFFPAEGLNQTWKMKQLKKSPHYTTNWHELLTIKI